jgi:hypothetical protein
MLAGLMYDDALPFFKAFDHNNGLFPDDVLEVLDDLGIPCRPVRSLPKRQPALVAISWRDQDFGGHYVVWDPERGQFIDPLHGLIGRREFLRLCHVDHVWSTGKIHMRQLVKARAASAATKELFEPFGPVVVSLGRTVDGGFIIEVCFASEPPVQALKITEVRGFPIVCVVDKSRKSC